MANEKKGGKSASLGPDGIWRRSFSRRKIFYFSGAATPMATRTSFWPGWKGWSTWKRRKNKQTGLDYGAFRPGGFHRLVVRGPATGKPAGPLRALGTGCGSRPAETVFFMPPLRKLSRPRIPPARRATACGGNGLAHGGLGKGRGPIARTPQASGIPVPGKVIARPLRLFVRRGQSRVTCSL